MPADLLAQLKPEDIRCPNGSLVGDSACFCGIEQNLIEGRVNPTAITAFCLGEYTSCPTVQQDAELRWAGEPTLDALVREADGNRRATAARKRMRAERRDRSMELLKSNSEEGRKFRGRLRAVLDKKLVGLVDDVNET